MRTAFFKLIRLLVVIFIVTFLSFSMLKLQEAATGSTIVDKVAPFGSPAAKARLKESLHLNDSFFVQYGTWLSNAVQGDFGIKYTGTGDNATTGTPVSEIVGKELPVSIELMIYAQFLALAIALPLGIYTAYKNGSIVDRVANITMFAMLAMPAFLAALALQIWAAKNPNAGLPTQYIGVGDFPLTPFTHENFVQMLLPTISLAVAQIAVYMRLLRSDMIATLQEDFITTAKAKGIPARRVLMRHAFRPSSLTLLTVAGLNVGALIGGAIIVEQIFNLPGIGYELVRSILGSQVVETQAIIAIIAVIYVLVNFLVDILYTFLDPGFVMPEQSPDGGHELVTELVRDEHAGFDAPHDSATIMFAAVESTGQTGRSKKKGIGIGGWLCVAWLIFLLIVAIAGAATGQKIPGLPNPKGDVGGFKLPMFSSGHFLGTDSSGQDILSLTANGTSASLEIGVFSVVIGFAVGGLFGILAGYFKGRIGAVLGSTTDILLAFPPLVLAISIVTFLGNSVTWVTVALAIVSIPVLARIARAATLSWAEREFVTAARAQGAKHGRVMLRELVPNVLPAMLSIALLGIAVVIVAEAGLAIVGAGVNSDTITWGSIINSGRQDITEAPHIVLIPSVVIFITVMALNYLGDALRAKFDVRESAL